MAATVIATMQREIRFDNVNHRIAAANRNSRGDALAGGPKHSSLRRVENSVERHSAWAAEIRARPVAIVVSGQDIQMAGSRPMAQSGLAG